MHWLVRFITSVWTGKNFGQGLRPVRNGVVGDDHVGVIHLLDQLFGVLDPKAIRRQILDQLLMRKFARRQAFNQLSNGGIHGENRARWNQIQKLRSLRFKAMKLAQTVNSSLRRRRST